jgi:1-phosphatidylinositol-4-phosphate 5-kinase
MCHFRGLVNDFRKDDGGIQAMTPDGKKLNIYYYIGIIDILMVYSLRKKAEHAYKSTRFKNVIQYYFT